LIGLHGWVESKGLTGDRPSRYRNLPGCGPVDEGVNDMPESKNDFRKALGSVIDLRSREAGRMLGRRFEHQLIGSFTKRP